MTGQRLTFTIPGEPKGKDRPRASARVVWKDGAAMAVVSMNTSKETTTAERVILRIFRQRYPDHRPWTGAVLIRFTAIFEPPASWTKTMKTACRTGAVYHVSKPDKDNIEKLIADALTPPQRKPGSPLVPSTKGYAWVDDAQVMGGGMKRYGYPARTEITLELLDSAAVPPTPAQKRAEARIAAGDDVLAVVAPRRIQPKSGKARPAKLQAAIDAALARDLFGDKA